MIISTDGRAGMIAFGTDSLDGAAVVNRLHQHNLGTMFSLNARIYLAGCDISGTDQYGSGRELLSFLCECLSLDNGGRVSAMDSLAVTFGLGSP